MTTLKKTLPFTSVGKLLNDPVPEAQLFGATDRRINASLVTVRTGKPHHVLGRKNC
jgi:hypothetical protein